jgi:feruloyl-CoA hydratase/lyase
MSEANTVTVQIEDAVAIVTLNRPAKRNAMSPTLHLEMADVLEKLRYEPTSRVLIITGAGESFCAGMDLKQFFMDLKDNPPEFDRIFRIATEWRFRTLRYYPKPTIAMVNGYCFGGAFSIVEGCDLAFAAKEATFGLSEVNFKHFPGGSVSKSLANLLRPRDALFYAMTGRTFRASTPPRSAWSMPPTRWRISSARSWRSRGRLPARTPMRSPLARKVTASRWK